MKNTLVPVDGSEPSLRALRTALDIIPADATLHVIAAQPPILSGNVQRFISASDIADYYQEEGEKALSEARAILTERASGANVSVVVGPVAESIVDYANDKGITHVFMGTRGLGGFTSLVLGSVTTKVLNLIDIPVTLVK